MDHKGVVLGYGLGAHRQLNNRMIIMVPGVTTEVANAMVGSKVSWPVAEPKFVGRITKRHGVCNGHLSVTFKRGLPGGAIGTPIKITTK